MEFDFSNFYEFVKETYTKEFNNLTEKYYPKLQQSDIKLIGVELHKAKLDFSFWECFAKKIPGFCHLVLSNILKDFSVLGKIEQAEIKLNEHGKSLLDFIDGLWIAYQSVVNRYIADSIMTKVRLKIAQERKRIDVALKTIIKSPFIKAEDKEQFSKNYQKFLKDTGKDIFDKYINDFLEKNKNRLSSEQIYCSRKRSKKQIRFYSQMFDIYKALKNIKGLLDKEIYFEIKEIFSAFFSNEFKGLTDSQVREIIRKFQ